MSFMKYVALKLDCAKTIIVNKEKFMTLINPTFLCPCGTDRVLPWITVQRLKLKQQKEGQHKEISTCYICWTS